MSDEIRRHRGADLGGGSRVAIGTVQIDGHVPGPGGQVRRGQRRRPAAPEQRPATDCVGETWKRFIADPGHAPDYVLRAARVIAHAQVVGSAHLAAQLLRKILNMRLQQECAGIEQQNPQARAAAMPIELFGAVAAEHARADDNDIEGVSPRSLGGRDLLPIIADVARNYVVAEIGLLHIIARGIATGNQLPKRHDTPLLVKSRARQGDGSKATPCATKALLDVLACRPRHGSPEQLPIRLGCYRACRPRSSTRPWHASPAIGIMAPSGPQSYARCTAFVLFTSRCLGWGRSHWQKEAFTPISDRGSDPPPSKSRRETTAR